MPFEKLWSPRSVFRWFGQGCWTPGFMTSTSQKILCVAEDPEELIPALAMVQLPDLADKISCTRVAPKMPSGATRQERRGTGLWRSPNRLMGNTMVRSPIIAPISWDMTCTITAIYQLITVSRTASTTSLIVAAQGRCRGIGSWCEKRWCWCENGRAVVLLVGITWF